MQKWLEDRRVLFAIGLAVTLLAIKWLFSDTLLSAADTIEEGKTGSATTAILPFLLDGFVTIMVAIGTRVAFGALFVAGRLQTALSPTENPAQPTATAAAPIQTTAAPQSLAALRDELADAVAANDRPRENDARRRLRLPFAMAEMNAAYAEGNTKLGRQLSDEVEQLIGTVSPSAANPSPTESPPEAASSPAPASNQSRRGPK